MHQVLSVETTSVWKPHPDAYAHAVSSLDVAPSDLVLVAVHPWDVDGAGRAGLRTVLLDRVGRPVPAAFGRADHHVDDLTALVHLSWA